MPIKKHFINRGIKNCLVDEYLRTQLDNSGYSGCALQKTPMGTRITIQTSRPGIVIGKKGSRIKDLTWAVKNKFNLEVPTIDVETVEIPELNAGIQAERIAYAIEKGQNYRRATYSIIRRIMKSGARGVEVHISGKVTSQRARNQVFRAGVINKCGTPAHDGVDKGIAHLTLKSGVLGIRVLIMSGTYKMPDSVDIRTGIFEEKVQPKKIAPVDKFYQDEIVADSSTTSDDVKETTLTPENLIDDIKESGETILETDEKSLEEVQTLEILDEDTKKEDSKENVEEKVEEKPKKKKKSTRKKKSSKKKKSTKKKKKSKDEASKENNENSEEK